LFSKAADQDDVAAQSNLGFICENGLGVRSDYIEAYKWLTLAAVQGDLPSRKELRSLKKIMTVPQIDSAYSRILTWKTNHQDVELAFAFEGDPSDKE